MYTYEVYFLRIRASNILKTLRDLVEPSGKGTFSSRISDDLAIGGIPGSFHGKQRGPIDFESIELVVDFRMERGNSDQRAYEFDFSVSKTKSGAPD